MWMYTNVDACIGEMWILMLINIDIFALYQNNSFFSVSADQKNCLMQ